MQSFGKYQLVRKLATGGMAEVFLANSSGPFGFEKTLVLKRILPHFAEDPLFTQMFLAEAKIAARLDHPNIVQVFDFGQVNGSYFLAMEYVDGPNLRTVKKLATERGEILPIGICVKLAALACEGLAYAHDFKDPVTGESLNLIHRDVSPDNILTSRVGAVKVADFGIAKASTGKNATRSGVLKGKLAYMPPEQLTLGNIDRRVDVFGLGMVLYELLSGTMPFDTTSDVSVMQAIMSSEPITPIGEMRKDIPEPLQAILARALQKQADARYPSCVAFQEELEGFLRTTGEAVSTRHLAEWLKSYQVPISRELSPSLEPIQLMPDMRVSGAVPERTQVLEKDASGSYSSAPKPVAPPPEPLAYREPGGRWLPVVAGFLAICLVVGGALWFLDRRSRPAPPLPTPPIGTLAEPGLPEAPPRESPPRESPPRESDLAREAPPGTRPEPIAPRAVATPGPSTAGETDSAPVSVQFRVRPYASVYLDGRSLGETPFGAVHVTPGNHKVRLVNSQLKMEKTVPLKVRSGHPMVFRYSFLE